MIDFFRKLNKFFAYFGIISGYLNLVKFDKNEPFWRQGRKNSKTFEFEKKVDSEQRQNLGQAQEERAQEADLGPDLLGKASVEFL